PTTHGNSLSTTRSRAVTINYVNMKKPLLPSSRCKKCRKPSSSRSKIIVCSPCLAMRTSPSVTTNGHVPLINRPSTSLPRMPIIWIPSKLISNLPANLLENGEDKLDSRTGGLFRRNEHELASRASPAPTRSSCFVWGLGLPHPLPVL